MESRSNYRNDINDGIWTKERVISMKISYTGIGIVVVSILIGFFIMNNGDKKDLSQGAAIGLNEGAQKVVIGMKDANYYPTSINVKAGKPVKISLDGSVKGCLRGFVIKDLGLSKYLKTAQDSIDVTFPKPGTYPFSCSMGMGTGVFIVE